MKMNTAISEHEAAGLAAEMFDHFCAATTMRQILGLYRNMCDILQLRPGPLNEFYPKFKSKIRNWKAQALWKKFDARASHRAYNKGTAASGTRVLVIGAGPCGLRTAIEAQLLGAKVVVVEKRDRISRNNVLHLWPFLITDLKALGAKKFYGKFCAGSIDHISIRQLQCILLKVALILGVEVHEGVSFTRELEPKDGCGWRAAVSPEDHAVSHYEFDVLIGADGKRNTLEGFKRKEFRGKLAIAITANFINKKTEAEAKVEEISGVAFIFNQSFFKELYQTTGIDLENIVYYKDETHYFVMTAKKHSLLDKGVIMQDYADPAELLSSANVDTTKLLDYAKEAANFSTKYQMPNLEFAVNHYGKPDVAMFDFTSMFAADNSCKITVRKNYRLLSCLVGDSLLEPFWPTGSGCARGFLSSMDAAYAIKLFSNPKNSLLAVLATRESIYRLLAQTTPENLHRDIGAYTVDPSTRYPNLNKASVNMIQVKHLLDTDDPALLEQTFLDSNALTTGPEVTVTKQRKRRTNDTVPLGIVLLRWVKSQLKENQFVQELSDASQCFTNGRVLCTLINRYRPDLVNLEELQGCSADECNEFAFAILEDHLGIPRVMSGQDSLSLTSVDSKQWLNYLEQICEVFRGEIPHVKHPKLDYAEFKQKQQIDSMEEFAKLRRFAVNRMQANAAATGGVSTTPAIMAAASATGIRKTSIYNEEERAKRSRKVLGAESSPIASPQTDTTKRAKKRRSYEKFGNIDRERGLAAAYPRGLVGADGEQFSDRIRSMEQRIGGGRHAPATEKKPKDLLRAIGKIDSNDWNVKEIEKKIELSKKATDIGKSRERVPKWNREQFLARQNKLTQQPDGEEKYKEFDSSIKAIDKQLKEGHNLDLGERGKNKVASIAGQLQSSKQHHHQHQQQNQKSTSKAALVLTSSGVAEKCHFCKQRVYLMEKISAENLTLHRSCLKCHHCHTNLRLGGYAFDRDDPEGKFYCTQHFKLPSKTIKPVPKRSLPRTPQQIAAQSPIAAASAATAASAQQPSTPDSKSSGINFDLLDRGETPERIEFENADEAISDGEAAMEVIDENEWTDRNFGTESDESDEEMSSSDESDSDSDSDYEEAAGSPLGAQTLQLASEWISDKRFSNMVDSDDDFYGYSSEDDEADSQTEGEELARAREMRMQEVKLMPPPTLPTDTETEVPPKSIVEPPTTTVPQSNLNEPCTSSSTFGNNPTAPPVESAEEKAIREKMLQKLSVREQWLHSSTPSPPPQGPPTYGTAGANTTPVGTPPPSEPPKPKTSFFGGLMNSLSTLIKSDKQQSPPKPLQSPPKDSPPEVTPVVIPPSPSPSIRRLAQSSPKPPPSPTPSLRRQNQKQPEVPGSPTPSLKKHRKHKPATPSPTPSTASRVSSSGHPDDIEFEEVFKEDLKECNSSGRSTPQKQLKRRSRPKVREEGEDDFLEKIKQDQAALDRRMKKVDAQKFKSNMQSIKSAVEGPRIVGVKSEKDVSKFFTGAKVEAKPKQLPNKDVSALQGVNLAKYFPNANPAPTTSPKASATPSSVSSVEGSPMLTRKKSSEVDLMKYFGPSTAKSSPSTPSSLASPAISRKNSVESPVTVQKTTPKPTVNLAPKPPVVPLPPKKNILAFQPIKKSSTESTIAPAPPSPGPTKNALAFQPVAGGKTPPFPKAAPKASSSPPKKTPTTRKSPDDDKLFDDLLKDIDKSPLPAKKLTKTSPPTKKKTSDDRVSPKPVKKSKPPTPKRRSPDLDEQLFEDLIGDVDDSVVENFEEIVGLPKPKQSPKPNKKKLSPKQSPKPVKKPTAPAVPKMTVKRPPFKITVPVKMQETLEEIYLVSLSKLDTRSASSTSLNTIDTPIKSNSEHDLGKVDEAFEALLQEPTVTTVTEPIKNQPFQAPQRKRTSPPKQAGAESGAKATSETRTAERTVVPQVVPIVPATPKVTKKNVETPKLSTQTESKQAAELPKPVQKFPLKLKQAGSTTSLDKVAAVPKKIDTGSKPATPVVARKVNSSPVDKVAKSETATPILNRKNVTSEQLTTAGTPVLARKATNSNIPTAVTNGEVVPKSAPASKVVKEPATPVASRKTDTATKLSTPIATKKIVPPAPGSATIVLAKNTVSSVSIEATPIATKTIDKTESVKPVSASPTPVLTKIDTVKEPLEPVIEAPKSPTEEEKPKQRKLSSDEVCFEELRKKHEAAFRGELEQTPAVQDLVDSKPVDVPRTLSEFRSSIICKPAPVRSAQQDGPASPVSDKISELVAEIMPGANLDDMMDDVPVPVERKKSSFAKMFHKLQRANTIAAMEASSLKPLAAKPNDAEYKIEVIRETPAKKVSPQPDRMKINLERSAQIKEQYAKQKAPSPPKGAGKVTPPTEVGRTGSFKIQSALPKVEPVEKQEFAPVPAERRSPTKKQLPTTPKPLERTESLKVTASSKPATAPVPMERRSPTKKQLPIAQKPLERTEPLKINVVPVQKPELAPVPMERRSPTKKQLPATPKPLERTTSLKVNAESAHKLEPAPKPMERKSPKKQLPTPTKPLERTTSLRVTAEAPKLERKPFQLPTTPTDIDHQLSILSRETGSSANKPFVVDFDDLLDSVETTEVVSFDDLLSSDDEKPVKTIPKKVAVTPVVSKVAEQKKVPAENTVKSVPTVSKVVTPVVPKLPEQNKIVSVEKIATAAMAPIKVTEKKLEASKTEQITPKNPLSEKEFTQAAQQLTDKFLNVQPKKLQESPSEKKDLKAEAMMTVLTEATDISVKETDLFDSLCETLNQDGSLISKSTTSLSTLPDLVSMTQKPAIEESKPLKVLDYTDKIKQIANHVPQEIQVYTLHTEEDKPAPQPSTSGVTNNYAHILKDITSGIVGSNLDMSVTYEPPPAIDRKPKSDFTTYKQMLQEKSQESPEPPSQQPQRPLRKSKQIERSVSPVVARPFDNSICVNPRRARKSPSIENIAIEQVFVKQDDKVIDTFYVVPEQSRQLKRRSKSYDRLELPSSSKASARQAKHSLDELRDYGFDIEPPSTVKHLVNPRLRHLDFEGSDEELSSFREPKRFERVRKCNSTTDTSKLDVEATRVDIDRESPIPRSTDFSKWEAILDRGVPYYKEQKHQKKEDVKTLERKLEDLKVERKPRKRFPAKTTIPKDYDPQEYVPRINRRFEEPDSDLPKWYDPDEYVPKAQRGNPMYETEVPVSRSHRAYDIEVPTSRPQRVSAHEMETPVSRPQRTSAHEMEVPISRVGGRYYHEPMHLEDYPHTLPRSKTASHIPYSSVSSRSHDLPSREITKTQYSRRAKVDNSAIVSRSQRLHEKANKYIRSQISKNDPNPYIRELADTDDEDFHLPVPSSTAHRTPITTSSSYHHPMTSYGSSGSAAMSRITTKAITQPSRMTHYARKDAPSSAGASSYRRGGESSNRRDNCAIS